LREEIAEAVRAAVDLPGVAGRVRRVLAAGFAASAHDAGQLDLLRDWLRGESLPPGITVDAGLRARIMFALAARGLASESEIDALAELDPVGGELNRVTCHAMCPDPDAKEKAWHAAFAPDTGWQLAEAYASGIWVPGQEELMQAYRERYFAEALPALARSGSQRVPRRLGRLLFPSTLIDTATIDAADAAMDTASSDMLRVTIAEQCAIARSALQARARAKIVGDKRNERLLV
jgi:aminopeptidase N